MAVRDIIQAAGGSAATSAAVYVEDVFSTYVYAGTGSGQTITNGIDLATKGGLVWTKFRSGSFGTESHALIDTVRGATKHIGTDTTNAEASNAGLTSFSTTGYSLGSDASGKVNYSAQNYASWTFRKQAKFFDVVTYTGNGTFEQQIAHSLGCIPGMIIVKCTTSSSAWAVYHNDGTTQRTQLSLNGTNASGGTSSGGMTSTYFTPGNILDASASSPVTNGATYVAYLFAASNSGGFGAAGTDSVVACGRYAGGSTSVNLGWEPQFLLVKNSTGSAPWMMFDTMRGLPVSGSAKVLYANTSGAEDAEYGALPWVGISSTGFIPPSGGYGYMNQSGQTYIYLAIRRGPMKTPTDATKVFAPALMDTSPVTVNYGFPLDLFVTKSKAGDAFWWADRLRGINTVAATNTSAWFSSASTGAEGNYNGMYLQGQTSVYASGNVSVSGNHITYSFRRAPGFFDVVCYTGTGSATTVAHNLGVAPELMIIKKRSSATSSDWIAWQKDMSIGDVVYLQSSSATQTAGALTFNNTQPTTSVFSLGTWSQVNASSATYVAYLFATCPGVSKVGSYTGSGTTKQIDCGFTSGARFVLIKRTDSTGDWYTWDSARGLVSGNDPYLLLNSTAAEVTNTDYIDPYSAGFEISSSAPAAINASGGTYIYLAIA